MEKKFKKIGISIGMDVPADLETLKAELDQLISQSALYGADVAASFERKLRQMAEGNEEEAFVDDVMKDSTNE